MQTFLDKIDETESIKIAKKVLKEYARLLKIIDNSYYDISLRSKPMDTISYSSYANPDASLIASIDRKDREYKEVLEYINRVQHSINCLQFECIEIIELTYLKGLKQRQIQEKLLITDRQTRRRIRISHIDFAIAYGIVKQKWNYEVDIYNMYWNWQNMWKWYYYVCEHISK